MDFSLTETQVAVRDVITDVLDRSPGRDTGGWKGLSSAGLLGIAIPDSLGGDGLGLAEVGVVLHEAGRRASDLPIWETLGCGVLTVAACGTEEQKADLLPDVATGECVLSAALAEPGGGIPFRPRTTLRREGERLLLSGRKIGVTCAEVAHRLLVPVTVAAPEADGPDTAVVLLDPRADGVSVISTTASRGAVEATVVLDDVQLSPQAVLGGVEAVGAAEVLRRNAVAGLCLLGDGIVAGARDLTAAYVAERQQFGKALAEFQAVAQQMADVYIASRTIGLAATSACWRLSAGLDADDDLAVAAYWFTVEAPAALHVCHHLHGGIGVDVTYPLHEYFSWAKDIARVLGGTHQTLDEVAARLVDSPRKGA
ncbi:MAG TPA: acyl-CoA dehydrogenase family protein [Nocardioidaceae bacterium]|nr:acyl-CoA dehydrogenase family protein [Nocardioidaceae bacterium]